MCCKINDPIFSSSAISLRTIQEKDMTKKLTNQMACELPRCIPKYFGNAVDRKITHVVYSIRIRMLCAAWKYNPSDYECSTSLVTDHLQDCLLTTNTFSSVGNGPRYLEKHENLKVLRTHSVALAMVPDIWRSMRI